MIARSFVFFKLVEDICACILSSSGKCNHSKGRLLHMHGMCRQVERLVALGIVKFPFGREKTTPAGGISFASVAYSCGSRNPGGPPKGLQEGPGNAKQIVAHPSLPLGREMFAGLWAPSGHQDGPKRRQQGPGSTFFLFSVHMFTVAWAPRYPTDLASRDQ